MKPAEARLVLARSMGEAELQQNIIAAAKDLGWLVYHTHDSRRSEEGFPDLFLTHPRAKRVLAVELKTMREKPKPAQRAWLDALNASGIPATWWQPIHWLDGTVAAALNPHAPQ